MIQAGGLAYYAGTAGSIKPLRAAHTFKTVKDRVALLWGDELYVIAVGASQATVSAKGHHLRIPLADLRETPLLSIYQIDCGQGDAALVQFPDGRWMMVDGGPPHDWSNSGKIAADFLYWKMFVDQSWKNEFDFRTGPFRLDAVVCTHPDYDHFGGLMDMTAKVRARTLEYGVVFHSGMGRFGGQAATSYEDGAGFGQLGPVAGAALPEAYLTALLDGFDDVRTYADAGPGRAWKLAGTYGQWLRSLAALEGRGVGGLQRVHHGLGHLPKFEPAGRTYSVRVLGPVLESWQGRPALRYLDTAGAGSLKDPSLTRNGQSVVLRIDYQDVRVLLTGDLNFKSHAVLLKHVPAAEFGCHVAKACHHGSEDVSATFLAAMAPLATMFSSGDNESYAHPRARVLGLAGACGKLRHRGRSRYLGLEEDRPVAPLIYSTELSRSVELFPPHAAFDGTGARVRKPQVQARGRTRPDAGRRAPLGDWLLADRMVYGLINVRTDGRKIVMAVLKESDASFQVEELTP
jgi:beta-lactamase superfamily II metal-dependent hydrolase